MEQDIASMTGQKGAERTPAYKLNEIKMSGDDGAFSIKEVLSEKGEDGKYPVRPLGEAVDGVILKMRWRLTRYVESPGRSLMTSEYDNKNTDKVIEFSTGDKGVAVDMKEKHKLSTQRVLYVYIPKEKEVVRIIVKASALSSDNNPEIDGKRALGLFEYIDEYNSSETYVHDYVTHFSSVFREGKNSDGSKNKRKDHYAMTFEAGRILTDTEKEKVLGMIKDVHEKTSANKNFAEEYVAPQESEESAPQEEINPDDVPF